MLQYPRHLEFPMFGHPTFLHREYEERLDASIFFKDASYRVWLLTDMLGPVGDTLGLLVGLTLETGLACLAWAWLVGRLSLLEVAGTQFGDL